MTGRGTSRMTTAERTARLWLRAYPRRWRYAYGEDLVGTLLDLAEPDATTVRLRDGLSVLRAGWSLRLREHPPLLPWLAYRLFERRLPARYRSWVMDDLLGWSYAARGMAVGMMVVVGGVALIGVFFPAVRQMIPPDPVVFLAIVSGPLMVQMLFGARYWARKAWRRHVGGWVPPELRRRSERLDAQTELALYRASLRQGRGGRSIGGGATRG
jgi:hypothetical protein